MRAPGDQLHIGLYREARGRKDAVATESLLSRKSGSFDQLQPLFDAARFAAVAIMIENALAPGAAERGILAARKDGGVFDRNPALLEVAVKRPCLQLTACQLALVHEQVKRMLVVIALFADGMKAGDELRFRKHRLFERACHWHGHSSSSMPS